MTEAHRMGPSDHTHLRKQRGPACGMPTAATPRDALLPAAIEEIVLVCVRASAKGHREILSEHRLALHHHGLDLGWVRVYADAGSVISSAAMS